MNIVYLKYAVTVAKAGSLTKAAEELFVAQPNLSRAIKELEKDLGITIFDRNSKGIRLTSDGEKLVSDGKRILKEIDEMEENLRSARDKKEVFSLSAPHSEYVVNAFAEFSRTIKDLPACDAFFREDNAAGTLKSVLDGDSKIGIVRYGSAFDGEFKKLADSKNLSHEMIGEFDYVLTVSSFSPLATVEKVELKDLADYVELVSDDPFVPISAAFSGKKEAATECSTRRIFASDKGGRLVLLSANPHAFTWSTPIGEQTARRYGLVQRICSDYIRTYKDVLIYDKNYKLTQLDRAFVTELCAAKRKFMRTPCN